MRTGSVLALVALLVLASGLVVGAPGASAVHERVAATSPLTGNVTGPSVFGYNSNKYLFINGTGGPAYAANGTLIGNVTFFASVTGANTTGVTLSPTESGITNVSGQRTLLTVGNVSEVLTVIVEITSTYQSANDSINISYDVHVVQPYVLSMTLVPTTSATILAFTLTVDLDGVPVGTISIPTLTGKQSYLATFQYATLGLSTGAHTFTVSLLNEHGLVTFAGGSTSYSTTFYIPGPPPNYEVWYIAGAVAFLGAIFIFVTRVAARRRNPTRK